MSKKMRNPKCLQNRHDCFACNSGGKCNILTNTEFKRKCPFYKKKVDVMMYEPSEYYR